MRLIYLVCGIFLCLLIVIVVFGKKCNNLKEDNKIYESIIQGIHEKHDLEYQDDTLIDISDWDHLKYYHVISIDNGKTWYLISDKRKIIGDFDKLYPKLRKKINRQHEEARKMFIDEKI